MSRYGSVPEALVCVRQACNPARRASHSQRPASCGSLYLARSLSHHSQPRRLGRLGPRTEGCQSAHWGQGPLQL